MREKELSRSTRRSRCHLLFFIGRPDLESVWGSGEGHLGGHNPPGRPLSSRAQVGCPHPVAPQTLKPML